MRFLVALPLCTLVISGALWLLPRDHFQGSAQEVGAEVAGPEVQGNPLPRPPIPTITLDPEESVPSSSGELLAIGPCTLLPIQEQQVSSQLDGLLRDIQVQLGQQVKKGAVLTRLEDQKLRLHLELLRIQATSDTAERIARAMYEEADAKVVYAEKANQKETKAVPDLEYKTYLAQRERFAQEISKAREERLTAQKELEKAEHLLSLHTMTSSLDGEVVKIFRKEGETTKQGEPLFRVARMDRLLIEGFCKVQQVHQLQVGARVLVEPELQGAQAAEMVGHTRTITALAVSPDGKLVISGSEDHSAILWSLPQEKRRAVFNHPAGVLAVAVLPAREADTYIVVTGCEDKVVRAWEFKTNGQARGPLWEGTGHGGPIRCIAIQPEGNLCATGSDDHRIALWNLQTGQKTGWVHGLGSVKQTAHQGAITSLHFTPDQGLVSAGRDNMLKVWNVASEGPRLVKTYRDRSGDLTALDVSGDGKHLLFDHGDEIRLLNRFTGSVQGRVENVKNVRFKDFACFSATGRLLLSATADGALQLWRTPLAGNGGQEVRHYRLPRAIEARCGGIAPDEKTFFTGGTDRLVRVWTIPEPAEWEPRQATLTFVGNEIEPGTDLVRIQAEMANPEAGKQPLRPGTFVTLKIIPRNP